MVESGAFAPALGSIVLIDQALKAALLAAIPTDTAIRVGPFLRIRPSRSRNTLATALGLPASVLPFLWAAILVALLFLAPRVGAFDGPLAAAGLGLALGGGASNVIDRLVRGGVVDYIDLRMWPAFNLADAAIVVGLIVAVIAEGVRG